MTEYNKLINDINNGKLSPVYLIHGEESYFTNNIIKNITDSVINETSADFDLKKIYGKKTDETQENEVIDFVKRFPLSGDYNLLIVKDSKNLSSDFKNIISYIENVNSKSILVLTFNNNVDKRKKIYKSSLKYGIVYESKKIYENHVYTWIENQCKYKSLNLHPNSIKIIADFTGNDLSQIDNELEKLKLNSSKDEIIRPEEVEDIIGFSKEYNFFELTKVIGKNNYNKSLELVSYMSKNTKKYPLPLIIGTVYSFFNKLFIYHSIENKNEASKLLGINPYFINEYREASIVFSMKRISRIFGYLLEADKRSKGIEFDNTNQIGILNDLIYKIFKSN
ncbi:MAG: DNA polymerase III subunit delta [Cryomorphaceae bacterium]|jgi:DNA polymerase-3 subunit delta|nr:DNA polymerase III subunit delta [Cryomorphaceae bacterium]MBT4293173.1 DNA polymerase III subunit delta [Cryomorphaceae bacterium]MBT6934810.1 DNA polymerase III subunit delta [Cryomorphaceae bacterium]MDG1889321.1 DNA polymerase III subunit delta [Flavobacteriaceae bacterium]|tara:strand:- start:102 stop:1112 length:1011 start_codon:yes stop_codon:yes gene_type:complete